MTKKKNKTNLKQAAKRKKDYSEILKHIDQLRLFEGEQIRECYVIKVPGGITTESSAGQSTFIPINNLIGLLESYYNENIKKPENKIKPMSKIEVFVMPKICFQKTITLAEFKTLKYLFKDQLELIQSYNEKNQYRGIYSQGIFVTAKNNCDKRKTVNVTVFSLFRTKTEALEKRIQTLLNSIKG